MASNPLAQVFGAEGRRLANLLRLHLPTAVLAKGLPADKARRLLQAEADATSQRLLGASKHYLSSRAIFDQVAKGQEEASRELGIRFGGVNLDLVDRLTRSVASKLVPAAQSPRLFVDQALRQGKAMAVSRFDSWASEAEVVKGLDMKLTASLLRGAVTQEVPKQMSQRILKDLNLTEGDKVILVSGRQYDAEYYAELVADTRSKEALNLAKAEQFIARGQQYIETSEHSGVPEDDICFELQGRVWALQANELNIPVIPFLPPWHPWCSHTFGAYIPELSDITPAQVLADHKNDAEDLAPYQKADGSYQSHAAPNE